MAYDQCRIGRWNPLRRREYALKRSLFAVEAYGCLSHECLPWLIASPVAEEFSHQFCYFLYLVSEKVVCAVDNLHLLGVGVALAEKFELLYGKVVVMFPRDEQFWLCHIARRTHRIEYSRGTCERSDRTGD